MSDVDQLSDRLAATRVLFQEKLGGKGESLAQTISRHANRLPRGVRKRAYALAAAEPLLAHPKLRMTQDISTLTRDAAVLEAHLKSIDLADQRKGWWLGMLGGMAFNILLLIALLVLLYVWRTSV